MSEAWPSLLAALVGAIVGGTFSLLGTMLVNKRQMATNARMRLYDEHLPNLERRMDSLLDDWADPAEEYMAGEQVPDLLEKVRRASAIAGRFERKAAHNLWALWVEHMEAPTPPMPTGLPVGVNADPPDPPGTVRPPSPAQRRLGRIRDEIEAFSDYLGAKLG